VAADDSHILVAEVLRVKDPIRPGELADVMEQARSVDYFLFGLVAACLNREGLRVAGDGGGMPGGRAVAQRERVHERG
jgi:hypothetical protein